MDQGIDIRALDEWMYAIQSALEELDPAANADPIALLQRTLDAMRERRAALRTIRHNQAGY